MTDEAKALVEQAAEAIRRRAVETCDADESEQWFATQFAQAALVGTGVLERLETQAREIERLRLEAEKQEALQVSAYHAGLKAGWNFCVSDDSAGMQSAMANTDHLKELRRIREVRAALGEK